MAVLRCRGRWFTSFKFGDNHVESYHADSFILNRNIEELNSSYIINPSINTNDRKTRLVYPIPMKAIRTIALKSSLMNYDLGKIYGELYLNYMLASTLVKDTTPAYYYLSSKNNDIASNSIDIDRLFLEYPFVKELINHALESIESDAKFKLHGRFTAGSIFLNTESFQPFVINVPTRFLGPLEYDLACLLQNVLERIMESQKLKQDYTNLSEFYVAFLSVIQERYTIGKELLICCMVYCYVGHINYFQFVQNKYGRRMLSYQEVARDVSRFISVIRDHK